MFAVLPFCSVFSAASTVSWNTNLPVIPPFLPLLCSTRMLLLQQKRQSLPSADLILSRRSDFLSSNDLKCLRLAFAFLSTSLNLAFFIVFSHVENERSKIIPDEFPSSSFSPLNRQHCPSEKYDRLLPWVHWRDRGNLLDYFYLLIIYRNAFLPSEVSGKKRCFFRF